MVKKLIDITRLGEYDELIKLFINGKFDALKAKIGTVPAKVGEGEDEVAVANLVDFLQKSIALVNKDAVALGKRIAANENEVQTLLPAYIDAAAAAAIAKVVGGATADYETLQKFEAWVGAHKLDAKGMQDAIKALQGSADDTKETASIPGVKLYIDSLVSDKNVDAAVAEGELLFTASATDNNVVVASTAKLQSAVERAENSVQSVSEGSSTENYVVLNVTEGANAKVSVDDSALSTKIDGLYTDIQGATEETVASVEAKVNDLTIADASDITALFD